MITREQIEQLGQLIHDVNSDKHYWFFRTMGGLYYDEFVSHGFIAIGYDDILSKDLRDIPERDDMARAFLKIRIHEHNKNMTDSQIAKAVGQIIRFYRGLAIGDVVIAPNHQSKKFAIGIIDSDMFEDTGKHIENECPFVKRRRVKWIKEVWRNELDAKAILAFSNQQTMSSIDEYADFIDRKVSRLYNKGDKTYLALRVNHEGPLSWDDWNLIGDLGAIFKDFSEENNLGVDLTKIEMKANVQSPGDIMMAVATGAGILLAVAAGIIFCIKSKSLKIQYKDVFKLETKSEGLGAVLGAISDFLDRNQERKLRAQAAEIKLKKMEMELPEVLKDVIPSQVEEISALPSSLNPKSIDYNGEYNHDNDHKDG
jgi:hypothetical protein